MALGRIVFTLPTAIFFVLIMPFIIIKLSARMSILNHYRFVFGDLNCLVGWILILIGLVISLWTVYVQIKRGLGTPIPMLPPEKLIVNGPYRYCRNPMASGTCIYYSGICFCLGLLSAFFIVIFFFIILSLSIKIGEEPDLEKRFGQTYIEYKKHTPFMIPQVFGKKWYFLFLY